jgi:4-amino-4-deoxy-L-arabinose transferase-like glycosyltransferase
LFFLPSLLFWTADISKETVMIVALGLAAYGAARVLMRVKGGYRLLFVGVAIGVILRPNEVLLFLAGLAIAMPFRSADVRRRLRGIRKVLTFVTVVGGLALSLVLYEKIFHQSGSLTSALQQVHTNNSDTKSLTFGSSNIPYSSNPLYYPRDVYTIMFDPLPVTAHGKGELLAALENTAILVIILGSMRQLRRVIRACRLRPYVLLCLIYTALFMYAFAALGNLGLIYRERTLLLPFLLVLLAIPISPKGSPPRFPWEKRVQSRRVRKRAALRGATVGAQAG